MDDAPKSDPRRENATIAADKLFRGARRHMMPADARHVLRYLAGRRNVATEQCNPGKGTIVDETGIAEQQVKAALAWLERHGWITVHREKLQGDVNAPNQYALHVWPGDMGRWATEQQAADEKAERVAANRAKRQGVKGGAASDLGPHRTQGEAVSVPGVGPHQPQGGAVSDHKAPSEAPRQAPMEAPRGGDAPRPGVEDGQVNLFGEVKSSGESAPKKAPPKKAAKKADAYGAAFVAGMAEHGITVPPLPPSDVATLGALARTFAPELTGDAVPAWIRARAAEMAAARSRGERVPLGGLTPWALKTFVTEKAAPPVATGAKGSSYGAPRPRVQPSGHAYEPSADEVDAALAVVGGAGRKAPWRGPRPQPGPFQVHDKNPEPVSDEERRRPLL